MKEFYIGLCLAFSSCFFVGVSFILKKKALLKSAAKSHKRAGYGGHSYLREWLWWLGVTILGAGEACNFAAFAFAPASLVTSLGALSVLVTVILSSRFLNEKLGFLGKVGCALCILGATLLVLHAPRDGSVKTMMELGEKMQHYGFIIYVVFVVITASVLIFYLAPRYGRRNILIYVAICSVIGSLTVLGCKGLGLAIKDQFRGDDSVADMAKNPLIWLWLGAVIFCISVQLNYLNKALDVYNISMVTSIYYVGFNCFVLLATTILYNEWSRLGYKDILGSVCGFLTTVIGVFQMQMFNDFNVTLSQLKRQLYKAGETTETVSTSDGESDDPNHKRRRSLVGSSSEPLLIVNHVNNGIVARSFSEKDGGRYDGDYIIPIHFGIAEDDEKDRDYRALSV